jgi:hypothetical protein
LLLFYSIIVQAARYECGDHASGITAYSTNGEDCCTDGASANGTYSTYERNNGVWKLKSIKLIKGGDAQNVCCKVS